MPHRLNFPKVLACSSVIKITFSFFQEVKHRTSKRHLLYINNLLPLIYQVLHNKLPSLSLNYSQYLSAINFVYSHYQIQDKDKFQKQTGIIVLRRPSKLYFQVPQSYLFYITPFQQNFIYRGFAFCCWVLLGFAVFFLTKLAKPSKRFCQLISKEHILWLQIIFIKPFFSYFNGAQRDSFTTKSWAK